MPKLPDATSLDVASISASRPIVSYTAGKADEALAEAGKKITDTMGKVADSQNRIEYAYAKSNLVQGQVELKNAFEGDQDYTTYQKRYTEKVGDLVSKSAAMISDPSQRKMFEAEAGMNTRSGLSDILTMARTQEKDQAQGNLLTTLDKNKSLILQTPDEASRSQLLAATQDMISAHQAKGYIKPQEAFKLRTDFVQDYGTDWLKTKSPEEQLKLLKPVTAQEAAQKDYSFLDTKLNPDQEAAFQKWKTQYAPKDSGADYDLRGAFLKGLKPDAESGHFPDEFKKPNHPTFSDQSKFAKDYPALAGSWAADNKTFIPAKSGGFDGAIKTVLANEGGYVPVDGASGAPAIYGINAKSFPDAYKQAKEITDTKGEEAGKQYASSFYKQQFWDKNGLDKIDPKSQGVVFDALVNHSTGFGQKILEAAKSGASPDDLIKMRRDEYQRLATQAPDKYAQSLQGWNNRLDKIQGSGTQSAFAKTGTPADFISPDKRAELIRSAESAVREDLTQRGTDPMAYAMAHDLAPNQPLNIANPTVLQPQLQSRANAAAKLHYEAGTPVQLLTNAEAKQLSGAMADMPTDNKLGVLNTFRTTLAPDLYQSVLQQIRPDSPVTAMAGMYLGIQGHEMTTDRHWFGKNDSVSPGTVAQHLLQGEELLNPTKATKKEDGTGKLFPMPKDNGSDGLRASFNDYVGDSFRGNPVAADQAYQAYRAYYAAEAAKQGDYSGNLNSNIADASTKAVIGNVVDKNGKNVIAPWGMDEDKFLDSAKMQFDAQVKANGYNPKIVDWSDAVLENTGQQGKYRVILGSGYLLGKDKKPVSLTISW